MPHGPLVETEEHEHGEERQITRERDEDDRDDGVVHAAVSGSLARRAQFGGVEVTHRGLAHARADPDVDEGG